MLELVSCFLGWKKMEDNLDKAGEFRRVCDEAPYFYLHNGTP